MFMCCHRVRCHRSPRCTFRDATPVCAQCIISGVGAFRDMNACVSVSVYVYYVFVSSQLTILAFMTL